MSLAAGPQGVGPKSVLMATDFSEASERPLRHALALARHYEAKFYLAHVVSSLGFTLVGPEAITLATEAVWRDARQLEEALVQRGALSGLRHEIVVRAGDIWRELETVIRQEQIEMVVIGTHGRRGVGKLFLGSVAEQIFRKADCLVLTVGPGSALDSPIKGSAALRPFLFATDFGEASSHALPYAISFANHFSAKLYLLHVIPAVPIPESSHRQAASEIMQAREGARTAGMQRLEDLISHHHGLIAAPNFMIEFGSPSEQILQIADTLQADAIIMGLHRSRHTEMASHLPWTTAYDVACRAGCAVLTARS